MCLEDGLHGGRGFQSRDAPKLKHDIANMLGPCMVILQTDPSPPALLEDHLDVGAAEHRDVRSSGGDSGGGGGCRGYCCVFRSRR